MLRAGSVTHEIERGPSSTGPTQSPKAVKVVGTSPENSHPRILCPVALPASAEPEARKFVEFLLSAEAAPAFEAQGFSIEGKVG